jgi:hypothetical protein
MHDCRNTFRFSSFFLDQSYNLTALGNTLFLKFHILSRHFGTDNDKLSMAMIPLIHSTSYAPWTSLQLLALAWPAQAGLGIARAISSSESSRLGRLDCDMINIVLL